MPSFLPCLWWASELVDLQWAKRAWLPPTAAGIQHRLHGYRDWHNRFRPNNAHGILTPIEVEAGRPFRSQVWCYREEMKHRASGCIVGMFEAIGDWRIRSFESRSAVQMLRRATHILLGPPRWRDLEAVRAVLGGDI